MNYTPHTDREVKEMLSDIGASSVEELFSDISPDLRAKSFNLPEGKSEFEVKKHLRNLSEKNSDRLVSFLGAGFYDHYIPSAVDSLSSRSEFYTSYTPYQPECSQGWLQSIYEYQTAICQLTGMEVSNASLYDGGTALFEAVMMASRITGRKKIIVDSGVNFIYRSMLKTYTANLPIDFIETEVVEGGISRKDVLSFIDNDTAAVVFQNPNFLGEVYDYSDIVGSAHERGALAVESVYPVSLGLVKAPGEMGVDIAVGEGQSLGNYLSFGGPYLGILACKKEFVRKMPGRIVGKTVDTEGKEGYVLTLQTREQHIRREKATSNICSNQSLCALRALIYLCLLGRRGLRDLAQVIYNKTEFAKSLIADIPSVEVNTNLSTFNEFMVSFPKKAGEVSSEMIKKGFIPGFPLGRVYRGMDNALLISVTEKRGKEEISKFAETLKEIL